MEPQELERAFERLGEEHGLDGRCTVGERETTVVFEDGDGHQHLFFFATPPTVEW